LRNRGFVIYGLLARHQVLSAYRAFAERSNAYVRVILAVMAMYFAWSLAVTGWRFGQIAFYILDIGVPTQLVNDYLFAAAFSLFGLRFLFGKSPRFRATPYLHLPIRRIDLVRYFQASSLLSLHNVFPLLFVVPFWINEVSRVNPFGGSGILWLAGIVLVLVISTWLNSWLRALLSYSTAVFAMLMIAAWAIIAADQILATYVINDLSRATFNALLAGNYRVLIGLAAVAVVAYHLASNQLQRALQNIAEPKRTARRIGQQITLLQDLGPVGQLLVVELKMLWRNRRPRHNLVLSALFSTVYVLALLITPSIGDNAFVQCIVGLFASGGFALNYGQLMFAWESSYFDGLATRDITTETMVRAKYVLLQLSCVVFFLISLPIFWLVRPDLLMLHAAFTLYNIGITSSLVVLLAVYNRKRIELWRSGSFFNYEGFSLLHWLWIIPIAAPPLAIMLALPRAQVHAGLLVALVGLLGLLLTPVATSLLADKIFKRRYIMLSGFRAQ